MNELLIVIQTLRRQLQSLFPEVIIVEVLFGQTNLTFGIIWQKAGQSVRESHYRIPWADLLSAEKPAEYLEYVLTKLREEYLKH